MRMLINGNSKTLRRLAALHPALANHMGILHTPKRIMLGFDMFAGADNDAFVRFDQEAYMSMLVKLVYLRIKWVTCPDVVGQAKATLDLFRRWQQTIVAYKLPLAFVAQDGIEDTDIPWSLFDCLFVGGSTGFKYSKAVIDVIAEAKLQGKLVHIGRVNTVERITYFFDLRPDSFDGSGYSRDSTKIIRDLNTILDLKRKL